MAGSAALRASHIPCGRAKRPCQSASPSPPRPPHGPPSPPAAPLQIKFLNRGTFGCVVLALNRKSGERVALKFIERGPEVKGGD